ncbi:hypothetical protein [Kineococcus sp. SYSU DK004]|uniref:hypothetical protein n=1 Tax=Kineococcus sp. SYSU DK004 TaxID=3383125 RepID=UPI003D7D7D2A
MSGVEGDWELVVRTPVGRQDVRLHLVADAAGALAGTAAGPAETVPLEDVRLEGGHLTWAQSITRPLRLRLLFDVEVDGDVLTGTSRAGRLPRSAVTGRRARPRA